MTGSRLPLRLLSAPLLQLNLSSATSCCFMSSKLSTHLLFNHQTLKSEIFLGTAFAPHSYYKTGTFGHIIQRVHFLAKTYLIEAPAAQPTPAEHNLPVCGVRHRSYSQCAAALSVVTKALTKV